MEYFVINRALRLSGQRTIISPSSTRFRFQGIGGLLCEKRLRYENSG